MTTMLTLLFLLAYALLLAYLWLRLNETRGVVSYLEQMRSDLQRAREREDQRLREASTSLWQPTGPKTPLQRPVRPKGKPPGTARM